MKNYFLGWIHWRSIVGLMLDLDIVQMLSAAIHMLMCIFIFL